MTYLREDIAAAWQGQDPLDTAFALRGEVFRDVPGRRTLRVQIDHQHFFVKLHYGVGWKEVLKNWLQLKRPVIGAINEYETCRDLAELGIPAPVPAAFAQTNGSIARQRSFVLCDELTNFTSLEDLTLPWLDEPPTPQLRHRLLYAVAEFARSYHGHGFIHRDFYICHLLAQNDCLAEGKVRLAVLDLHRARRFERVPERWLLRDLAALLYSTLDLGYTRADWLRFVRLYSNRSLAEEMLERGAFWRAVLRRAEKLYQAGLRKQLVYGRYSR